LIKFWEKGTFKERVISTVEKIVFPRTTPVWGVLLSKSCVGVKIAPIRRWDNTRRGSVNREFYILEAGLKTGFASASPSLLRERG